MEGSGCTSTIKVKVKADRKLPDGTSWLSKMLEKGEDKSRSKQIEICMILLGTFWLSKMHL